MSIAPIAEFPATLPPADIPDEPVRRLTVEQYHQMLKKGILQSGDPIELLEGWLIEKMTKNPRHSVATRRTRIALERLLPAGWCVDTQDPVTTGDSEPEPDVRVARGEHLDRHPGPGDTGMVAEVSEANLRRDRNLKQRVYARARIPRYWIVNLVENQVEVYSDPTGPVKNPKYREREIYRPGDKVPVVIDGKQIGSIQAKELLP